MNSATMTTLQRWRTAGWLRALDLAFAAFLREQDAGLPPSLLLAGAWLAQLEGRGHSCLPLDEFTRQPLALLAWPDEARPELDAALADWPAERSAAREAWGRSAVVQIDPKDETGSSPLVLDHGRLYLRRYWRHETRVAAWARARTLSAQSLAPPARIKAVLDRLFDAPGPDWQKIACALALRGRLTLITGGPGTGKTYTAARLLVLLRALHDDPQDLRIALAAPTGKAAARLRQSIEVALEDLAGAPGIDPRWVTEPGPAKTLHSLLGSRPDTRRFAHDASNPLDVDVLFVDEASMVHLEMMASLLDALPPTARLVLLGDKDQLASVEAGAVMGDLCQAGALHRYRPEVAHWLKAATGQSVPEDERGDGNDLMQQTVTLRASRRFSGPIGQLALAVNRGDAPAAIALLRHDPLSPVALLETRDPGSVVRLAIDGRPGAVGSYRVYVDTLRDRPAGATGFEDWVRRVLRDFDRFRVLTAVREGPWGVGGLNLAIERALAERGHIAKRGDWYEGRPVMVTRNDPSLGVYNGDIGIVLRSPSDGGTLRAWFLDGLALRSVAVGRLADVETAYVLTVHKSQGSEFEHVALVLPPDDSTLATRELVYTGITRAREALTVLARDAGRLAEASTHLTRRVSGLSALLGAITPS